MQAGQVASITAEGPEIAGCGTGGGNENPALLALSQGLYIIEQLLRLGRGCFFNRDCEKVDGRTA